MHGKITALAATGLLVAVAAVGAITLGPGNGTASSHREAPLIAEDPSADLTDLYAFRSPDKPNTVTILANVLLQGTAEGATLAATDNEVGIRRLCAATAKKWVRPFQSRGVPSPTRRRNASWTRAVASRVWPVGSAAIRAAASPRSSS